jgi:DeoR/GlpR family transcriptional regulator of sugar metabolism
MKYLTTKEASKRFKVSEAMIRRRCRRGEINGAWKVAHRNWLVPIDSDIRERNRGPQPKKPPD